MEETTLNHDPPPQNSLLSTTQAAACCGVSPETIRRWIRAKGLPAYNTDLGVNIRIRWGDLEAFARRHNVFLRWPGGARPLGTPPSRSFV